MQIQKDVLMKVKDLGNQPMELWEPMWTILLRRDQPVEDVRPIQDISVRPIQDISDEQDITRLAAWEDIKGLSTELINGASDQEG